MDVCGNKAGSEGCKKSDFICPVLGIYFLKKIATIM